MLLAHADFHHHVLFGCVCTAETHRSPTYKVGTLHGTTLLAVLLMAVYVDVLTLL